MIDARTSMGGIERYVCGLLRLLESSLPQGDLIAYGRDRTWERTGDANQETMAEHKRRGPLRAPLGHLKRIVVDQSALPRAASKSGVDLLHTPAGLVPRGLRVPVVAVIHDLWLLHGFETKKQGPMKYYERAALVSAIHRARQLIVPSRAVARQLSERFGAAADRVRVIHPPLVDSPAPGPLPPVIAGRLARGFFLSVGTIEPRKNLERLARAHRIAFEQCGLPWVVAGGYGWRQEDFIRQAAGSGGRILWLGFVDDATLAGLYARATCLVQASLDEGFSYPVAEAMAFGALLVLSDIETHREVAADLAAYAPPDEIEALAEQMLAVAGWPDVARNAYAERARQRLAALRRGGAAELYLNVYREAIG